MPVTHKREHSRTETLRRKLLAEAATRWNASGLRYSVVNGAEQYPTTMGRDLDVMADPSSEEEVIGSTLSTFRDNGWTATAHRTAVGVTRIIGHLVEDGTTHAAEIDVATVGLRWGPVVFLDRPSPEPECARRGPFVVDLWGSFAKRILVQALSGNIERIGRRSGQLNLSGREAAVASERLAEFANETVASDFVRAARDKDLDQLRACTPPLRRALLRASLRGSRLATTVRGGLNWVRAKLALNVFMRKGAPVVTIVGPDAVGRREIIEAMRRSMRHELAFPELRVRRCLRPAPSDELPAHDDGNLSFRSAWKGGADFLRHALSYLCLHLFRDRQCSARLFLVVYDPWLLDALARGARRESALEWGMRTLLRLLPRPDLVILLRDDSGPRQGAPSGPSEDQRRAWRDLVEQGYVDVTLEADAPPAEVARRVIRAVVREFTEMHAPNEPAGRSGDVG